MIKPDHHDSKHRLLLSWSSGKDSAWCLHMLRQQADIDVVGLITTFTETADRVAMHAVRRRLVEEQAESAGLPLVPVFLPWPCSNADYEAAFRSAMERARSEYGIDAIAFGDLFLEDIRSYREGQMQTLGLEPLFPIWRQPTDEIARAMIAGGVKAYLTCVDPKQCPADFAGREFDFVLLNELPVGVDPCGENGEFHTFVFDGPMFATAIDVRVGETVERDGFVFADILPLAADAAD